MNKKQREAQRRQEDAALNRALVWAGGAIVLELLLIFVKRYYIDYSVATESVKLMLALHDVLSALRVVGAVAAVACLVWVVLRLKKSACVKLQVALTVVCAAISACAYVTVRFKQNGIQMLLLLVPACAGLALVYYLYQKEFFLSASATGLAVLGLWFARFVGGFSLEAAAFLCAIAVVFFLTLKIKKADGEVKLGGKVIQFVPKGASYLSVRISCAIGFVAVAAALVLGTTVAYYLLFLMIAWLFALLVYYTVKMM